jgi:integrase
MRSALIEREIQLKNSRTKGNQWRLARGYPLLPAFDNEQCADHLLPMVLISINTGLRQGELFNLNWDMVDPVKKSLFIDGGITKNNCS